MSLTSILNGCVQGGWRLYPQPHMLRRINRNGSTKVLIPLNDAIWSRLYGPYGIEDVAAILSRLSTSWDSGLAEDLYWEKLHHQQDLYPVTYAALPWLLEITTKQPVDVTEFHFFLSHVLSCAFGGPEPKHKHAEKGGIFSGLSLSSEEHGHAWIPKHSRLLATDMPTLQALQEWLTRSANGIAETCLLSISQTDSRFAAQLCEGFCAVKGGGGAVDLLALYGDGHEDDAIREEVRLGPRDVTVLNALSLQVADKNKELNNLIARHLGVEEPDPRQISLF